MLRRFGSMLWSQSREMRVMNYSNHMVYQLYTNHGYIYVTHEKSSDRFTVSRTPEISEDSKKKVSPIDDLPSVWRE